MQRRDFIQQCSSATAAMMLTGITGISMRPSFMPNNEIFVLVFLRGGCDGLQLIAPVNDPHYFADREPALRVTESGENGGIKLKNGLGEVDFRLHAAATHLKELYD
ncbi:MAG: twin-arginine translocation signal domain-containing protein, partial [Sphingobacteriia bacterium]